VGTVTKGDTNIIFSLNVLLIIMCIYFNISLILGFAGGIILSLIMLKKRGFQLDTLIKFMIKGVKPCTSVLIIIALMGCTISIWLASGIVPTIIYYGYNYIGEVNFVFACFLIAGVTSIFMGTALGTFSTIGMALYGLGIGLSIPKPLLLGAIISGVFLADKISPISSLANLTLKLNNLNYKEYLKTSLKTLLPSIILSMAIFYILGLNYTNKPDIDNILKLQQGIAGGYNVSPLLLLFPVIMIVLAVKGTNIIYNMVFGIFGGTLICLFVQKLSLIKVFEAVVFGYKAETAVPELNKLLQGGGAINMVEVMFIVVLAVALTSLLEGLRLFEPLVNSFINKGKTKGSLICRTAILSSLLTMVTCDQTVGILLPSKLLKHKFEDMDLKNTILARTISDSGTIIAPLMAWNVNAIIITSITGVSPMSYGKYTLFCYITPIVTLLAAYIGNKTNISRVENKVVQNES